MLEEVDTGEVVLVSSFVVEIEHDLSPLSGRREDVALIIDLAGELVRRHPAIFRRTEALERMGLKGRDALHLAAAEYARVDYFVTCDDKLLRRALRLGSPCQGRLDVGVIGGGLDLAQTRDMTDEEIIRIGYRALLEKLGPVGFIRFIRQHKPPEGDYLTADKPIDDMTVEQIYEEAVRLEKERNARR